MHARDARHGAILKEIGLSRLSGVDLNDRLGVFLALLIISFLDQALAIRGEELAVEGHAADGDAVGFGARGGGFAVDVGEDGGDVGAILERDAGGDAWEEDDVVWEGDDGEGSLVVW